MGVPQLLTTEEVAERLQVSRDFVYEHAGELGAIRAGRGSRSPLRFHPDTINDWIEQHRIAPPSMRPKPKKRPGRPRKPPPADFELLPPAPKGLLKPARWK